MVNFCRVFLVKRSSSQREWKRSTLYVVFVVLVLLGLCVVWGVHSVPRYPHCHKKTDTATITCPFQLFSADIKYGHIDNFGCLGRSIFWFFYLASIECPLSIHTADRVPSIHSDWVHVCTVDLVHTLIIYSGGQNYEFRPLTSTLGGRGMGCRDKYVTSLDPS